MYKTVIFIDFENLQKIDTNKIDTKTKIIVMVGLDQENKAIEFISKIIKNVSSIELIKINGRGKNAMDFFIAFYLGKYYKEIKDSKIIISSKDKGYDPLIKHLDGCGMSIEKINVDNIVENIESKIKESKTHIKKQDNKKNEDENNNIIISYLQKQTKSQKSKRPQKLVTLENYLYTHFAQKISMEKIKKSINFMKENNYINILNNKIKYINI
jgi:hypothetical protein